MNLHQISINKFMILKEATYQEFKPVKTNGAIYFGACAKPIKVTN